MSNDHKAQDGSAQKAPGRIERSNFMRTWIEKGATVGQAMDKADRLSHAQFRLLQSACERSAIEGWRASASTFRSLLARGLIHQPHVSYADSTQFFYLTDFGRAAIAKATGTTS